AFRAGASGFVTKLASEKDLLHAIAELRAGRSYRMPALERYSRPDPDEYRAGRPGGRLRDPLDMLSPRQRQVFLLTGYGKTTQESLDGGARGSGRGAMSRMRRAASVHGVGGARGDGAPVPRPGDSRGRVRVLHSLSRHRAFHLGGHPRGGPGGGTGAAAARQP